MTGYQLTNAEHRLLREQSSLGRVSAVGWVAMLIAACAILGGFALAAWGTQLAISGVALLPGV